MKHFLYKPICDTPKTKYLRFQIFQYGPVGELFGAGGKPSTRLPPGGLVEQLKIYQRKINNSLYVIMLRLDVETSKSIKMHALKNEISGQ